MLSFRLCRFLAETHDCRRLGRAQDLLDVFLRLLVRQWPPLKIRFLDDPQDLTEDWRARVDGYLIAA